MILKLTNMSEDHKNKTLLINPRHILTIFEITKETGGKKKTIEKLTHIYSVTQQIWIVKESVNELYQILKDLHD